ncbi:cell division topological specificity factor MinE [cf. Phormidesmis sp. LEGE 11477]|nr:cell division topological specificity factor MinE [cf. Phormidesmis sp. LEGE 11477]
MISDLLEKLFGPPADPHSRDDVKRRLRVVLAHDRLAIDPQTLEMMRQEIIAVVSRYVEIDFDSLEFSLGTDQRMTALTANLPIRRIRPLNRGADEPIAPEAEASEIELASQGEIMAMNAEIAKAKLQRLEAEDDDSISLDEPLDIDRSEPGDLDLENSDLEDSDLEDSDLEDSDLEDSDLGSLSPENSDLDNSNNDLDIGDSDLDELALNKSELDKSELDEPGLGDSELDESKLDEPDLNSSDVIEAELGNLESDFSDENSEPPESDIAVEPPIEVPDMSIPESSVETIGKVSTETT